MNDFFLAFMFLRFYFLVLAFITFSPVNERLYGKRVCKNAGFEPTFGFQIKAAFKTHPIFTFTLMAIILLASLSYVTRVFERPYFAFNFKNPDGTAEVFFNWESLWSALWYSLITMSSVGYGGYTASTPMGRGMTILTALIGAFLLAILVAIITDLFLMTDR